MAAIKLLLGIFCLTAFIGALKFNRYSLKSGYRPKYDKLVHIALAEIGTRELTGKNDGLRVEEYLASVHLKRGQPWCAAFISWVFKKAGFLAPRSGWCPDLFPTVRLARDALPGNVIGIYFPELKRVAHVGLITAKDGDWLTTVEGNTNVNGSREGDGVYAKRRHRKIIYRIADWVTIKKK